MTIDTVGAAPRPATRRVLPGFGLTMGITLFYLALIVLLPVTALVLKAGEIGGERLISILSAPRTLAAIETTVFAAACATALNAVYGLLMAWVLVRTRFAGHRIVDALIDLPFALPTSVAGVALTALFAGNGWFGRFIEPAGIQIAYALPGVVIAMAFTSVPFVVRTVQPVLEDLPPEYEEAAATLGASPFQIFRRIVLPAIAPAYITGLSLAFARCLGEFGAVIFIAGNLPMKTEIAALLIFIRLEEFDYPAAAAIATVLLAAAFLLLLTINTIQAWQLRYAEKR
ncbi:MAG: sulfate ABC transporter permease subunit CysT [Gemmatimonas sp.]